MATWLNGMLRFDKFRWNRIPCNTDSLYYSGGMAEVQLKNVVSIHSGEMCASYHVIETDKTDVEQKYRLYKAHPSISTSRRIITTRRQYSLVLWNLPDYTIPMTTSKRVRESACCIFSHFELPLVWRNPCKWKKLQANGMLIDLIVSLWNASRVF